MRTNSETQDIERSAAETKSAAQRKIFRKKKCKEFRHSYLNLQRKNGKARLRAETGLPALLLAIGCLAAAGMLSLAGKPLALVVDTLVKGSLVKAATVGAEQSIKDRYYLRDGRGAFRKP